MDSLVLRELLDNGNGASITDTMLYELLKYLEGIEAELAICQGRLDGVNPYREAKEGK